MEQNINIAVLGNFTTEYLAGAIFDECRKRQISANIYNSEYNQYNQDILDNESSYYLFNPELTIILLEGRLVFPEWYKTKTIVKDSKEKSELIDEVYSQLVTLVETILKNCNTTILINNFKTPYFSPLGILDNKLQLGLKRMISRLNEKLENYVINIPNVYVFDYNGLCSHAGISKSEDKKMYYIAKNPISFPLLKTIAYEYMRYILPVLSKNKKCLVLDLDNTLWGGIVGEDGAAGISLDIDGPGRSYFDFQQEVLNLYHKGIILTVNSKNNVDDVMSIFDTHPYMLLKKEHFSIMKINWQDKVQNLKEIAQELNIGVDSLVFFDDNPVEREGVKAFLPQVTVTEVPVDSSKYTCALLETVEFEKLTLTQEDVERNKMYKANKERDEAKQRYKTREEFLVSLQTEMSVAEATPFTIPRIAQLTQKTNQFNMTTRRYDEQDILEMNDSDNYKVFCCSIRDRFGDNGITGVCIIKAEGTESFIDTFLLSCRVLGRDVEYAFLSQIVKIIRESGISRIYAEYIGTQKNTSNHDFYLNAGFSRHMEEDGRQVFVLDSDDPIKEFNWVLPIISTQLK